MSGQQIEDAGAQLESDIPLLSPITSVQAAGPRSWLSYLLNW